MYVVQNWFIPRQVTVIQLNDVSRSHVTQKGPSKSAKYQRDRREYT